MQRILIFVFALWSIIAQAQVDRQKIDALVPQEKISTGILYNRVMPFAGLQVFEQNGRKDTSSYAHL